MSHPDAEFLARYLEPLRGATIQDVRVSVEDDLGRAEAWPTLVVNTVGHGLLELEIGADEEGNGPGFVFGLPLPKREGTA